MDSQAPPASASIEDVLAPERVVGGRYQLVRELGRGASGVVWLAAHRLLKSDVAVKFLDTTAVLGAAQVDTLLERFRFEAQVSARLAKRTNKIVAVHDGGLYGRLPYIVMDFVDGSSVESLIDRAGMSAEEVVRMVRDVAEALSACHAESIAHRDVKPANILAVRAPDGRAAYKLTDFGVAKLFGRGSSDLETPRATAEQVLVGSPGYMSPEAITGAKVVSGSSDTWALAATAYEALTRQLPFDGEAWTAMAVAIMAGRFTPLSVVLGEAGRRYDPVFQRAFCVDAASRYASPQELADALERASTAAVEGDTFAAVEQGTHAPDGSARRRWVAPALVVALLGLGVGAAALLTRGKEPARDDLSTVAPPPSVPTAEPVAEAPSAAPRPEPTASDPPPTRASSSAPSTAGSAAATSAAPIAKSAAPAATSAAPIATQPPLNPRSPPPPPPPRAVDPSETH